MEMEAHGLSERGSVLMTVETSTDDADDTEDPDDVEDDADASASTLGVNKAAPPTPDVRKAPPDDGRKNGRGDCCFTSILVFFFLSLSLLLSFFLPRLLLL